MFDTSRTPKWASKRVGISVGKGWHPIIEMIHNVLPEEVEIHQIKEKFGTLRVYYSSEATPEQKELVAKLIALSGSVCEHCGDAGELSEGKYGWGVKVLCPEHAALHKVGKLQG